MIYEKKQSRNVPEKKNAGVTVASSEELGSQQI